MEDKEISGWELSNLKSRIPAKFENSFYLALRSLHVDSLMTMMQHSHAGNLAQNVESTEFPPQTIFLDDTEPLLAHRNHVNTDDAVALKGSKVMIHSMAATVFIIFINLLHFERNVGNAHDEKRALVKSCSMRIVAEPSLTSKNFLKCVVRPAFDCVLTTRLSFPTSILV